MRSRFILKIVLPSSNSSLHRFNRVINCLSSGITNSGLSTKNTLKFELSSIYMRKFSPRVMSQPIRLDTKLRKENDEGHYASQIFPYHTV